VPPGVAHDRHAEPLHLGEDVLSEAARVRELRSGLVNASVDRPAEVLQEGSQEPAVEVRAIAGALEDRACPALRLRIADGIEPGSSREGGARAAQRGDEVATAAWMGHWTKKLYEPECRISTIICRNRCRLRVTLATGTRVAGSTDRSSTPSGARS